MIRFFKGEELPVARALRYAAAKWGLTMKLELGIGNRTQSVDIPDHRLQQVLLPNEVAGGLTGETEIRRCQGHYAWVSTRAAIQSNHSMMVRKEGGQFRYRSAAEGY